MRFRVNGSVFDQDKRDWIPFSEIVDAESGDQAAELAKAALAPRAGRVAIKGIVPEAADGERQDVTDAAKNHVNTSGRTPTRSRATRAA